MVYDVLWSTEHGNAVALGIRFPCWGLWLCGVPGRGTQAAAGSLSLSTRAWGGCRSLYERPGKLLEATDCGTGGVHPLRKEAKCFPAQRGVLGVAE